MDRNLYYTTHCNIARNPSIHIVISSNRRLPKDIRNKHDDKNLRANELDSVHTLDSREGEGRGVFFFSNDEEKDEDHETKTKIRTNTNARTKTKMKTKKRKRKKKRISYIILRNRRTPLFGCRRFSFLSVLASVSC